MKHIGIEIAATEVRIVEISRIDEDGFAVLSKISVSPIPEGAVVAGKIRNPAQVAFALKEATRLAKIPKYGFVLGFCTADAGVYRIEMPSLIQRQEREGSLRASHTELNPAVPVLDAAIATYKMKSTITDREGKQNIAVTYVRESDLEDLLGICDLTGLEPKAVDLSPSGTMRALLRLPNNDDTVSTVVDIGATKITVATRQGQDLRSLRVIPSGSNDITKAIAAARGIPFADAERVKQIIVPDNKVKEVLKVETFGSEVEQDRTLKTKDDPAVTAAGRAIETLVEQIAIAVESDAALNESFTSSIALCGLGSLQKTLKEAIEARVGVPTIIGRPWARVEKSSRNAHLLTSSEADPKLILSLATVIGLAMWEDPK